MLDLPQCHKQSSFHGYCFLKFVELCEMCCRIACSIQSNAEGDILQYSKKFGGIFP